MPARTHLLFVLLLAAVGCGLAANPPQDGEHCIWYGRCGNNPDLGEDFVLNCYNDTEAIEASAQDVERLTSLCPHFLEDLGPPPWNLCCSSDQVCSR